MSQVQPVVQIVAAEDGCIFHRVSAVLAEEFKKRGIRVFRTPRYTHIPESHATLYLPYYFNDSTSVWDVPVFTHLEREEQLEDKRFCFQQVAYHASVCVAMSNHTATLLPPWKTVVIEIPATPDFLQMRSHINILCPTTRHTSDRKNLSLINRMASSVKGVEFVVTNGCIPQPEMPAWYNKFDYVLVTGTNEGGPMSVKEAIAVGKPVIAPNVGWAWEYPVIRYNDADDLERILRLLAPDWNAWNKYADALLAQLQRSPQWPTQLSTESTSSPGSTRTAEA